MSIGFLMLDGPTTLHDVVVGPSLVAGLVSLCATGVWWGITKKKSVPRPYSFRALLASGVGLVGLAVFVSECIPDRPLW